MISLAWSTVRLSNWRGCWVGGAVNEGGREPGGGVMVLMVSLGAAHPLAKSAKTTDARRTEAMVFFMLMLHH